MRTIIVLLIVSFVTALIEMLVCLGTKNGVKRKEVQKKQSKIS